MASKHLIIEGISPKTSVSKLVFHLLENSKLKKHQIGRIQKLNYKFSVEIIELDDDDLKRLLNDLENCEIDQHKIIAWSKDLEIDSSIKEHFQNLEKWLKLEIEEERKTEGHAPFARFKCTNLEPSIHASWILEMEFIKNLNDLEMVPKVGQPLTLIKNNDSKIKMHAIVLKWHDGYCRLSLDYIEDIDELENEIWDLGHCEQNQGRNRALDQAQRVPYCLYENLQELFEITLANNFEQKDEPKKLTTHSHQLNSGQDKAYLECIMHQGMHLIQGPPGTGKSRLLTEILKACHQNELKVLVAASTHAAVDHLLSQCNLPETDLLRIGHHTRISKGNQAYSLEQKWKKTEQYQLIQNLKKEHGKLKQSLHKLKGDEKKELIHELRSIEHHIQELLNKGKHDLLMGSSIVFTTHTGFMPNLFKGLLFDVVIVDEAAQCCEIDIWLTLFWGKKWILAGDPCQLPALVKSPKAKVLEVSLMQRMIDSGHPYHLLEEQYRMHESIAEFSSQQFYEGNLKVANPQQNQLLNINSDEHEHLFWLDHAQVFIDTSGSESSEEFINQSYQNLFEAEFLTKRIRELLEAGIQPNDIGLICPYSAQSDLFKDLLKESQIEIANIDAFQGREKKVILISCVRANFDGKIGFLSDTRRMNVALTRAKQLCVVIGDSATLANHPFYESFLNWKETEGGLHSVWEWSD